MKEIKFRVWNVIEKKMLDWGDIFDKKAREIFPGTPEQGPYQVMQYTGLKDKNGKEIYEGDIIKTTNKGCFNKEKFFITYDNTLLCNVARFTFLFGKEYDGYRFLKISSLLKCEIIGNIYENPELLQ